VFLLSKKSKKMELKDEILSIMEDMRKKIKSNEVLSETSKKANSYSCNITSFENKRFFRRDEKSN